MASVQAPGPSFIPFLRPLVGNYVGSYGAGTSTGTCFIYCARKNRYTSISLTVIEFQSKYSQKARCQRPIECMLWTLSKRFHLIAIQFLHMLCFTKILLSSHLDPSVKFALNPLVGHRQMFSLAFQPAQKSCSRNFHGKQCWHRKM